MSHIYIKDSMTHYTSAAQDCKRAFFREMTGDTKSRI
jgi:hypothetical protein